MAKVQISTKRMAIDKANAQVVAVVAAAAFATIFCLFAAKTQWDLNRYQARVTEGKETARQQLEANLEAFKKLRSSYRSFDGKTVNIIGGTRDGSSDRDGRNSTLILNALPSVYDFPALASSLEKILTESGLQVGGIEGTDDQLNQQSNLESPEPQPVEIPFSFSISEANYESVNQLVTRLGQSIRPIQIDTIELSGDESAMSLSITAHTYYQPAKNVNIKKEVVK